MPGNTIRINESDDLDWYIGDSKMEELIEWLDRNGVKVDVKVCECKPGDSCNICGNENKFKMYSLDLWIEKLIYPGKIKYFFKEIKRFISEGESHREICFFTDEFKYRIYAIDRPNEGGYLGCQVSSRKIRPGEDWTRGNDLADGPFIIETWFKILSSIVSYELVKLSEFKQPDSIPDE